MNIAQQLFVVFFAIFWGTSSNAWPGWKPFHWTFVIEIPQIRHRVALSMLLLNILPITYFAVVIAWLGRHGPMNGSLEVISFFREVVRGIGPAFAVFGFYRMWFGIIERRASLFYLTNATLPLELKDVEPTSETLHIGQRWWHMNVIFGLLYVVSPLPAVWLL